MQKLLFFLNSFHVMWPSDSKSASNRVPKWAKWYTPLIIVFYCTVGHFCFIWWVKGQNRLWTQSDRHTPVRNAGFFIHTDAVSPLLQLWHYLPPLRVCNFETEGEAEYQRLIYASKTQYVLFLLIIYCM